MIIIALSNLETDYKQVVDQAVHFFKTLPSNQIEYVDYDRNERYPLTHFIFIGDMISHMEEYAISEYHIDKRFFYRISSGHFHLSYENEEIIKLLQLVKVFLNSQLNQNYDDRFNIDKIVFSSPPSIAKRFSAMVYTMFHDFRHINTQFLCDDTNTLANYNEDEIMKLMSYLSSIRTQP